VHGEGHRPAAPLCSIAWRAALAFLIGVLPASARPGP